MPDYGGQYNLTQPTLPDKQVGALQLDANGNLRVTQVSGTLTSVTPGVAATSLGKAEDAVHATGDTGVMMLGVRNDVGTVLTSATGDYSSISTDSSGNIINSNANAVYRLPSALGTTNAAVAKATPGTVFGITAYNASAAVKFVKLYQKATAPTVGTDTPFMTFAIGPSQGLALDFGTGVVFTLGIAVAITGLAADTDATAVTAGDIVGLNVQYR